MDRYSGRDERDDNLEKQAQGPAGNVARLGLSSFVKAQPSTEGQPGQAVGQIQVVASRREQRQQAAAQPARLPSAAPAEAQRAPPDGLPAFVAPAWAGPPPPGARLQAYKDGVLLQEVPLDRPATLFGRHASAHVVLEHPSLSRQHAYVAWQPAASCWLVTDLHSAHGTWLAGQRLPPGEPTPLVGELRFAASSRSYRLASPPAATASQPAPQQQPNKKRGVLWADKAAPEGDAPKRGRVQSPEGGGQAGGSALEQVIGYSDSSAFSARVGPVPASKAASGRFADLVHGQVVHAPTAAGSSPVEPLERRSSGAGGSPRVQPKLKQFVEQLKKRPPAGHPRSLYD